MSNVCERDTIAIGYSAICVCALETVCVRVDVSLSSVCVLVRRWRRLAELAPHTRGGILVRDCDALCAVGKFYDKW